VHINLTGHRPFQKDKKTDEWISKLEYTNDNGVLIRGNSKELYTRLIDLFTAYFSKHRPSSVTTGMAMGVDLAGAEAALSLGIPIISYVPYPGHGEEWKTFYKERHQFILNSAEKIFCPEEKPKDKEYRKFLLQRNVDMVNDNDYTIALWDGSPGGTAHCVNYSKEVRGEADWGYNLWDFWDKHKGRK
jgi:uncharacterized phage-like protein YoqJ